MSVTHCVCTNSREETLLELLNNLVCVFPDDKICIFDSGCRSDLLNKIGFIKSRDNINIFTNNGKNLFENILHSLGEVSGPSVFYHDDDGFDKVALSGALNICRDENINLMFSLRSGFGSGSLTFGNFHEIKAEDVVLSYFLDDRGNCPLISGVYFRDPLVLKSILLNFSMTAGKYSDVVVLAEAVKVIRNIRVDHYISYNEHHENDNNVRCIKSRDGLSKYLKSFNNYKLFIVSKLIFFGYSSRVHEYLLGLCLVITSPRVFSKYFKKSLNRIRGLH